MWFGWGRTLWWVVNVVVAIVDAGLRFGVERWWVRFAFGGVGELFGACVLAEE